MQNTTSSIGVIGLGDLGSKLATQLLLTDYVVLGNDKHTIRLDLETAISERASGKLNTSNFHLRDVETIVKDCSIIHWAAPSSALEALPTLIDSQICVLHDSVMFNSVQAIRNRPDKERFVIAHCVMNSAHRVFVCTETGDWLRIFQHFSTLNLVPKEITSVDHDSLMAHSQGVFALLIELGLREFLDSAHENGDLTPSAEELRLAVINREARWTQQTIQSILRNPELSSFVDAMKRAINSKI